MFKNSHFCDFHNLPPLGISQLVSGLYYVAQDTGCNIHIGAKLYTLGRAKVFSSVATNFGPKTIKLTQSKDLVANRKSTYSNYKNTRFE